MSMSKSGEQLQYTHNQTNMLQSGLISGMDAPYIGMAQTNKFVVSAFLMCGIVVPNLGFTEPHICITVYGREATAEKISQSLGLISERSVYRV